MTGKETNPWQQVSGRLADAKIRDHVLSNGGILTIEITQRPGG